MTNRVLEKFVETDQGKIHWNLIIQIDHVIEHIRKGVVVLDKMERMCHLIDMAMPRDIRVASQVQEKIQ